MESRGLLLVVGVALTAFVTRCVGDSTVVTDAGSDATTDVSTKDAAGDVGPTDAGGDGDAAVANKHAYATNFSGALVVFDMPLTNGAKPTVVLTNGFKQPSDVEIVPGGLQLLVVDGAGGVGPKLFVFNLPITAQSVAVTAIPLDFEAIDGTFDLEGNLWLAGFGTKLEKFTPPLASTSTASQTITMPTGNLFGINVTSTDELFVGGTGHVYRIPLPSDAGTYDGGLDNTSVATPTGIAFNNQALFVSNFAAGVVDDLAMPVQSSTPATPVGAAVLTNPVRLRFTSGGTLGVADAVRGIVMLDGPAYNSASVTVPAAGADAAVTNIRGICFGP